MPNINTQKGAKNQQASSPTFKKIVRDVDSGKITLNQAINKIVPSGTPLEIKNMLARAMGTQSASATVAKINNKVNNKYSKKTQTRKPSK